MRSSPRSTTAHSRSISIWISWVCWITNLPLATVIVPHGELVVGKQVAEIELKPSSGPAVVRTVNAGEIVRLPLARGKRATLRIRPVSGIAIGQNKPGTEVRSDEAAIAGSALGVIFDARPRPLALPEDAAQRRDLLLRWCVALDALPPATTFAPSAERSNGAATNGTAHSSQPTLANGSGPTGAEVAAMREELLSEPKKRGFWRK